MAQAFEPRIVYARETEGNRFILVINMMNRDTKRPYYIGGLAVLADIHRPEMPGVKIPGMQLQMQVNFVEYREVDPASFIAADMQNMQQLTQSPKLLEG